MKLTQTIVTPELAAAMLEKNNNNRPLNRHHVAFLSRQMKNGSWMLNGDTICLSGDSLIDGQHRLRAVIDSGVDVEMVIVTGVSDDAFKTKDTGRTRKASDVLAISGYKDTSCMAAVIKLLNQYYSKKCVCMSGGGYAGNDKLTNADVLELAEKYEGLYESIKLAYRARNIAPKAALASAHFIFSQIDSELADKFINNIADGSMLEYGDPALTFRNRMFKLKSTHQSKSQIRAGHILALLIKAWNRLREGKQCVTLRMLEGEEYPTAI